MLVLNRCRTVLCAGIALAAVVTAMPAAQADDANKVLATVNGQTITPADIEVLRQIMGESLNKIPEANRQQILLNILIETLLVADQAEKDGIADTEAFKRKLRWRRLQALRDAFVEKEITSKISDADVHAQYEVLIKQIPPQEEVHARHILVKTEDEAKKLIAELENGADFAELAKANSTGPTGPKGGDLGFFGRGRMVAPFDKVAFELKPGEYTKTPVQTQFGWHVIQVLETRMAPPPPYDAVKDRVREKMTTDRFRDEVKKLQSQSKIEIAK